MKLEQQTEVIGTNIERNRYDKEVNESKKSLIHYCLTESSKSMSIENFSLAIPSAILALKYCKELHGEKSIEIVEPNLHLGQAFLSIKEYPKALEYLSLARWIVLNSEECSSKTRSRLHMLLGRVHTAQGTVGYSTRF